MEDPSAELFGSDLSPGHGRSALASCRAGRFLAHESRAKNLLEVLSPPFHVEAHEISIGASIGISLFPENATAATDLLRQADSAMYLAKQNGKNRVMYFTPKLESLVRERLSLENQLRAALARSEITLHYQPEFDLASHRLIRFEALARWQHASLGNISPSKFIPIAEESGLIVPLGTPRSSSGPAPRQ